MEFIIRKANPGDAWEMTAIFNHYIKNGTAAFLDEPVETNTFYEWLKKAAYGDSLYVVESQGKVAGFGVIKQYYDCRVFKNTAEPGYFFLPEFTGKGAGTKLLETMAKEAKPLGIRNFIVSISSQNKASIEFHKKNGFNICGDFKNVGFKQGLVFDVVWMQKVL